MQLWVDEPSFALIEKYCRNMEVDQAKFLRDAVRAALLRLINNKIIKNDSGIHDNLLLPKPTKGRPRKVKLGDDAT